MNLFSPERTLRICTIVALAAVGAVAANGALLKGPFVILEDTERLSIRMEVEQPDYEVILIHGELERTRSKPVFSRSKRDTFLAKVGVDLKELRKFRGYEIWSEGEIIGSYDWRSRVDGTFQDYPRLLVFGDSQGGKETLSRLGKRWMQEEFDLLVALGDLVDTGSRYESWEEELFGPLSGLLPHYPILTVCGNHESYRERSFYWFDWFLGRKDDKRFFKMDFRDLRLVGINNSDVHTKYGFDPVDPLMPQYDFMVESMLGRDAAAMKIVVFSHVPIFSGSTVVNDEFGSELQRKYILPLIERSRTLGFFSGHHHKYERLSHAGVRGDVQLIVTGGGGGGLFDKPSEPRGFKMDREVFEIYHYLTVDFRDDGLVRVKTIDGDEIDRLSFGAFARPAAAEARPEFWEAELSSDFSVRPVKPLGDRLILQEGGEGPSGTEEDVGAIAAELYRTSHGMLSVIQNLQGSVPNGRIVSMQGYQWDRASWGYLQGAILSFPARRVYGMTAVVSLNGTNLSPFDHLFPVLHWPVAARRAGITEALGAVLLLRGVTSFDRAPDPNRILARWRWGEWFSGDFSTEQVARQLSVVKGAPAPSFMEKEPAAALLRIIDGNILARALVVKSKSHGVLAVLVHWPRYNFVALIPGENLPESRGAIFFASTETKLSIADEKGFSGILVRPKDGRDLFIPFSLGSLGASN